MMSGSSATLHSDGDAAFAICEAAALATTTQATLAVLASRLDAFADGTGRLHEIGAAELERLTAVGEEVAELASQIAMILDGLPPQPLTVADEQIAAAARAALADGILDQRRALTALRLLSADEGFAALAAALIDSDAHAYWSMGVVELLATLRDVDERRARQVAALAGVTASERFDELAADRVLELAHTLRQLAKRD